MWNIIVEWVIRPFFAEKLRVLRYYDQNSTAKRLLAKNSSQSQRKGLSLLFELATAYPYRAQEAISVITAFIRERFPQANPVSDDNRETQELAIRLLAALPRLDTNGYPFHFDLHQVRIEHIDLTRLNLRYFSLWGARLHHVEMPHSSFAEADLGGVLFDGCSLEFCDFAGAKLCDSFIDKRRARIVNSRLWGASLERADIRGCDVQIVDGYEVEKLKPFVDAKKLHLFAGA